jgi:tetratricopeptide (TPR) repeat protein
VADREAVGGEVTTSQRIAQRLTAGIRALKEGQAEAAAELLEVCVDPEWVAATDTEDLRCRALSLSAQALMRAGRLEAAQRRAEAALALARSLGEVEGTQEITELLNTMAAERVARPAPAARRWPSARNEGELQAAADAIDAGDLERGRAIAEAALSSGDPRTAVLGRLLIVRADPDQAAELLPAAAEIAREAEEPTLLGAVARAASLYGVDLGTLHGPERVADRGGDPGTPGGPRR